MKSTIRLIAAQALVSYFMAQLTEDREPFIAGVWTIFDRDWELNTQLADLEYQISQFSTQNSTNVDDLRSVASAEFISLSENIDALLSVWVDEGLRSAGQLFAVQAPPQLYSGAGSVTPRTTLTLALALVLGVFVGLVAVLLRGAMRPAA